MDEQNRDKLELIASKNFKQNDEMYKIVDYLNKNLKHRKVMFGLQKNSEDGTMTITIYEI